MQLEQSDSKFSTAHCHTIS